MLQLACSHKNKHAVRKKINYACCMQAVHAHDSPNISHIGFRARKINPPCCMQAHRPTVRKKLMRNSHTALLGQICERKGPNAN